MQQLLQKNNRLRQIMQKCQQQIIQLRKIGQQHQQQIDNLLKFNERLLSIIQTQMPNKTISRSASGGNLQPIDQAAGEKEHQVVGIIGHNGSNNNGSNNNSISSGNNNNGLMMMSGLVNNQRFVNMQVEKHNAIKQRVQHLQQEQVQHLSQQQNNYTHNHHNYNNNNNHNNYHDHHHQEQQVQYNNSNQQQQYQQQQLLNHNNSTKKRKQIKFINTQSYSPRTNNGEEENQMYPQYQQHQQYQYKQQQQQQYDQQDEQRDNVIYRQEKQSLIDIPKLFKLQKGLNQHYHKQLFHSVEDQNQQYGNHGNININNNMNNNTMNNMNNNNNKNYLNINNNINTNYNKPPQLRKLSIPSQTSQLMGKISQAQTQRLIQQMNEQQLTKQFKQIKSLIHQYRQDFNLQQCLHLCDIIKQDLQNDLVEIREGNVQRLKMMDYKQRQCQKLGESIERFSGVENLLQIMKRLNVSRSTQNMVMERINGGNNGNIVNINNSSNSYHNNNNNINSMSNVSIMARNR